MKLTTELSSHLRQITWRDFLTAQAKLIREIDAALGAVGTLSLDWFDVLLTLNDAPGRRLRLNELADQVLLSRSGITRLVDRIEAQGLLVRERCADDRRGAFAVLTEAGRAALKQAWPIYERLIEEHFGRHMTDDEAMTLHRVFTRMAPPQPPSGVVPLSIGGTRPKG